MELFQIIPMWSIYGALGLSALLLLHFLKDKIALVAIAVLAVFTVVISARKQGWKDREMKGVKDAYSTVVAANTARMESDRANRNPDKLRESDGFRRD